MNVGHVTFETSGGEMTRRQFSGPPHAIGKGLYTAMADHFGESEHNAQNVLLGALCQCFDPDARLDPERLGRAIKDTLEVMADESESTD